MVQEEKKVVEVVHKEERNREQDNDDRLSLKVQRTMGKVTVLMLLKLHSSSSLKTGIIPKVLSMPLGHCSNLPSESPSPEGSTDT